MEQNSMLQQLLDELQQRNAATNDRISDLNSGNAGGLSSLFNTVSMLDSPSQSAPMLQTPSNDVMSATSILRQNFGGQQAMQMLNQDQQRRNSGDTFGEIRQGVNGVKTVRNDINYFASGKYQQDYQDAISGLHDILGMPGSSEPVNLVPGAAQSTQVQVPTGLMNTSAVGDINNAAADVRGISAGPSAEPTGGSPFSLTDVVGRSIPGEGDPAEVALLENPGDPAFVASVYADENLQGYAAADMKTAKTTAMGAENTGSTGASSPSEVAAPTNVSTAEQQIIDSGQDTVGSGDLFSSMSSADTAGTEAAQTATTASASEAAIGTSSGLSAGAEEGAAAEGASTYESISTALSEAWEAIVALFCA